MGAFVGGCILAGCCVVAWSVYYVGRRIARVLFGIGVILESDAERKAELERRIEQY